MKKAIVIIIAALLLPTAAYASQKMYAGTTAEKPVAQSNAATTPQVATTVRHYQGWKLTVRPAQSYAGASQGANYEIEAIYEGNGSAKQVTVAAADHTVTTEALYQNEGISLTIANSDHLTKTVDLKVNWMDGEQAKSVALALPLEN